MKWLIWAVSVLAYVLAVINRSSFSALGPVAQEHFGAEATALSTFVTVQLVVYAGAQIPVGIALDRWGAPTLITSGLSAMAAGQFLLGASDSIPVAIIARILVGAGDACIFTSMVRLISEWFGFKQIPVMNQLSGNIGQIGQIIAVTPLVMLVAAAGWQGGFSVLAVLCLIVALASAVILRDNPRQNTVLQRLRGKKAQQHFEQANLGQAHQASPITEALPITGPNSSGIFPALKALLKRPGIRMAFWVHLSTSFTIFNFTLLWGTPFVTGGLGYSQGVAAMLITTIIITTLVFGVFAGGLLTRFASYRVHMALGLVICSQILWAIIVLMPGQPPLWLLFTLVIVLGMSSPISMVAFELVRAHAPLTQRGVATGIANMGGYVGAFSMMLIVGLLLDAQGAGSPDTYAMQPFKWAMASQLVVGVLGICMILREYPKAKKYLLSKYPPSHRG